MAQSKRIQIVPAVYALESGKVEWLEAKAAEEGKQAADKKTTTITVRVPSAEARVWVDDRETTSRGMSRTFQTPALGTGRQHSYQIKASWLENGREVTREKAVTFKAGEPVAVEFK
jgi:uncharacterized protein (TIGR03000 family)